MGGEAAAIPRGRGVGRRGAGGEHLPTSRGERAAGRQPLGGLRTRPLLGGFAGATYVTTVFTANPAIGAAATADPAVAGQRVASVFVDRFGWFRLPERPVPGVRLAGVVLLLAGVAAIKLAWAASEGQHGHAVARGSQPVQPSKVWGGLPWSTRKSGTPTGCSRRR